MLPAVMKIRLLFLRYLKSQMKELKTQRDEGQTASHFLCSMSFL